MAIQFGSKEAQGIIARDKIWRETQKLDDVDPDWLKRIEDDIDDAHERVGSLIAEMDEWEEKIETLRGAECPVTGLEYREIVRLRGLAKTLK